MPVVAARLGGLGRADEEIGADAVGDERLRAVDDVAAVDPAGEGADPRDVGAGARLGDPERGRSSRRGSPGAGSARAARGCRSGRSVGWRCRCERPAPRPTPPGSGRRQLLGPDRVVNVVAALAAELLGVLEAQEAELAGAGVELARELARLLPVVEVGDDLLAHPASDGLAKRLVLVGERRQQRPLAGVLDDRHRVREPVTASNSAVSSGRQNSQKCSPKGVSAMLRRTVLARPASFVASITSGWASSTW